MNNLALVTMISILAGAAHAEVSDAPDVAFKLATFETGGQEHVGILIDDRLLDLQMANAYLEAEAGVPALELPLDMKALIEQSNATKPRLFQIANFLAGRTADLGFGLITQDGGVGAVGCQRHIRTAFGMTRSAAIALAGQ